MRCTIDTLHAAMLAAGWQRTTEPAADGRTPVHRYARDDHDISVAEWGQDRWSVRVWPYPETAHAPLCVALRAAYRGIVDVRSQRLMRPILQRAGALRVVRDLPAAVAQLGRIAEDLATRNAEDVDLADARDLAEAVLWALQDLAAQ